MTTVPVSQRRPDPQGGAAIARGIATILLLHPCSPQYQRSTRKTTGTSAGSVSVTVLLGSVVLSYLKFLLGLVFSGSTPRQSMLHLVLYLEGSLLQKIIAAPSKKQIHPIHDP